jgi:hypothetical protein
MGELVHNVQQKAPHTLAEYKSKDSKHGHVHIITAREVRLIILISALSRTRKGALVHNFQQKVMLSIDRAYT